MPWIVDLFTALDAFLLDAVTSPWMLLVLAAVCLVDGVFPPVPSEIVLLAAVTVTWSVDPLAVLPVLGVALAGAWLGDGLAYLIGRRLDASTSRWLRRGSRAAAVARIEREFARRPASILLTGRFIPVARVLVNVTAGLVRLPYRRFAVLSLLSASLWVSLSAALAVLIGAIVSRQPLLGTLIAVAIALTGGLIVDRLLARRRRRILLAPGPEPLETASAR